MNYRIFKVFIVLTLLLTSLHVAGKVTVSGYIRDAGTGEELIGANVYILESGVGTITNIYGYYSLSINPDFYTLVFSYVGYQTVTKPVQLGEDIRDELVNCILPVCESMLRYPLFGASTFG